MLSKCNHRVNKLVIKAFAGEINLPEDDRIKSFNLSMVEVRCNNVKFLMLNKCIIGRYQIILTVPYKMLNESFNLRELASQQ